MGFHFNYNGKYTVAEKQLAEQGRKASFALSKQIKDMYLNVESTIFLFDTYISSILKYVSEVWGMDKGVNIEKLHLDFCKRLLGVKKSTCNIMVYCELGQLPLKGAFPRTALFSLI